MVHLVARHGRLQSLKYLLQKAPELLNETDFSNETALHLATRAGHIDIIKYLISVGADINAETKVFHFPS